MQYTPYTLARQSLIQDFSNGLPLKSNEQLNGQFTLVSAGLSNYLPSIRFKHHANIFTNLLLHKKLSLLEQGSAEVLAITTLENYNAEVEDILKNKPAIICTFHTGSYRLINLFLAKEGIQFSLIAGKDVIKKEGETFRALYKNIPGNAEGFTIIDAEASNSGLQMLRELKNGKSLLIYLDGNTGAGGETTTSDNHSVVDFLHQQLFARKGIGFLAHAAAVPIVPVVCYRKSWTDIRLQFCKPIYPLKQIERTEFAQKTTQHLYDLVAPIIRQYPEQWEAWLYLHKVARIVNSEKHVLSPIPPPADHAGQVIFNGEKFGLYKISGCPFLFQKSTYFSYPIDRKTYGILSECASGPVEAKQISIRAFQQLYSKQVLVKV